jgi:hypothetical protein
MGETEGSFDDSSLDEIKAFPIALQITDESNAYTDAIIRKICETFYLVQYQDKEGYECIKAIFNSVVPSETIAFNDCVPKSIGKMILPKAEDIYCEPVINYAYDYATKKYTKQMSVTGIADNSVWSSTLTPGITDAEDAEVIWNQCKALYLKYGRINKMPDNLSNNEMIIDEDTALWKMQKVVSYQGYYKIQLKVRYSKGRLWYPGYAVYLQLPNETNNTTVKSILTSIKKNKRNNSVDITLKIVEDFDSTFYFTRYQATDGAALEWQITDGATDDYQERG